MGFTPIKLDKMRNLRYGMKAISLVEKKLGQPIGKIDMDNMTMEDTATLIWAGLVHEDKNLTPDKVMDLVDEHSSLPEVMQQLTEAINASFGAGAVEEEGAGKNE
jgi:hypothetical protein